MQSLKLWPVKIVSRRILAMGALVLTLAGTSCRSPRVPELPLIPGFEVLPFPGEMSHYVVGAPWLPHVGTSTGPVAPAAFSPGLDHDLMDQAHDVPGDLAIPLQKWIADALGLPDQAVTILQLTNLSHITVSEVRDITYPVLWETIVFGDFTFRLNRQPSRHVNIAGALSNSFARLVGNRQLNVSQQPDGTFLFQTGHPLVLAIRVVRHVQKVTDATTPLDLAAAAVRLPQSARWGYTVTLPHPADPVKKEAQLDILNPGNAQFQATNHIFRHSEEWITPAWQTGIDQKTHSENYTWDEISIQWDNNPAKCKLEAARYDTRFVPMKSGLPGVK